MLAAQHQMRSGCDQGGGDPEGVVTPSRSFDNQIASS